MGLEGTALPEEGIVSARELPPRPCPGVEVAQLDRERDGLERIEAGIDAELRVDPGLRFAVGAQAGDPTRERRVGGDDAARIAEGSEVLGRVEGQAGGPGPGADRSAFPVEGADRLGGVFDDRDPALAAEALERSELADPAEQIDGQDCLDPGQGTRPSNCVLGIEVQGIGSDVAEGRCRAEPEDRRGAREERVGGAEHDVAGTDVEGAQCASQRASVPELQVTAWGAPDRNGRELGLEGPDRDRPG